MAEVIRPKKRTLGQELYEMFKDKSPGEKKEIMKGEVYQALERIFGRDKLIEEYRKYRELK